MSKKRFQSALLFQMRFHGVLEQFSNVVLNRARKCGHVGIRGRGRVLFSGGFFQSGRKELASRGGHAREKDPTQQNLR